MSSLYNKFRNEIVAGGDTTDQPDRTNNQRATVMGGLVLVGLIVWLGVENPWTLVFVIGLLISVFLHEVGHFVTARRTGMKVTQFFMGFGPRLWSTQRGEVEYGVRVLPLGAFVRIVGMNNLDECDQADEPRAYRAQSYPKRMLVITAGSLMHGIIAFVLFVGVYSVNGRYDETGNVLITSAPAPGSPAFLAGVREGDIVRNFDGVVITDRDSLVEAIVGHQPGQTVTVQVERGLQQITLSAALVGNPVDKSIAYFGVASWSRDYVRHGTVASIGYGVRDLVVTAQHSVAGVFVVLNPVNIIRSVTAKNPDPATRPGTLVGASQLGGELGRQDGLKGVLLLLATINVFVGVFNMFPLLPFDGGHAAIATYERFRSRRNRVYRADVGKMVPVATAVVGLLSLLLMVGLYLDVTQPLG
ncbi:MAG: RIP metalloprotease [Actinobacteria bacterium]|nr:MAG: RIP metalloprotease [Actinomycetota bacterium]